MQLASGQKTETQCKTVRDYAYIHLHILYKFLYGSTEGRLERQQKLSVKLYEQRETHAATVRTTKGAQQWF